jgi:SAM-dependent methyltransferase
MDERLTERIPEPELMDTEEQALAYAMADFSEAHGLFIDQFHVMYGASHLPCRVLDLGCGPADITVRFATAYPACHIDAVDGAEAMLRHARRALRDRRLEDRIRLVHGHLPQQGFPQPPYDVILSNSLLHHLADPMVLWNAVKMAGGKGTIVFVMDLLRPTESEQVDELVVHYAGQEPEILQSDFRNSLFAAYRPDELAVQLAEAQLNLEVSRISDRHLLVHGILGR